MKFVCENPECVNYQKIEEYHSSIYRMIEGHLISDKAPCPKCGKLRREINDAENVSISEKNISLLKYSMASAEGKREMLKKRSHDHFEKEIKPYKEHQISSAMEEFRKGDK